MVHGPAAAEASASLQGLQGQTSQLPQPVAGLVKSIGQSASSNIAGATREQIRDEWNNQILPHCEQALQGRYPFQTDSPIDVQLDDFIRLFSPNGQIDQFVTMSLKQYIDFSHPGSWAWQRGNDLGLGSGALVQFKRAAEIRDSFFPAGGAQPVLKFTLTPTHADAGTRHVVLTVDGQAIDYAFGPPSHASVQWPAQGGLGQVRLAFLADDNTPDISATGPWAWFRFLDQGRMETLGTKDHVRVSFAKGSHSVDYEIQAGSVSTPLSAHELGEFRCPHL
jgi:type VI secretion system protein ImpL